MTTPAQNEQPDITRRQLKRVGQSITSFETQPVHWLWRNWLPRGAVSMLASRPGIGKSTATVYLAMCAAGEGLPGRKWPNGEAVENPAPVLMLSFEDSPSHTLRPIYNALDDRDPGTAHASRINVLSDLMSSEECEAWTRNADAARAQTLGIFSTAAVAQIEDIASPDIAEAALDAAYGRDSKEREGGRDKLLRIGMTLEVEHQMLHLLTGVKPCFWIVDPFANLTSSLGLNENNNAEMNSLLRFLSDLADRHDVALLVVHHNRKQGLDGEAVFEQRGASAITAAVRSQIALDRGIGDQRIMGIVKSNWGPERGVVTWEMREEYAARINDDPDEPEDEFFEQPSGSRDIQASRTRADLA